MNIINSYNGKATYYVESRPGYPANFIADLYTEFGFSENAIIADIGCGTGKFALELLKRKSFVYCVEPNDNMRLVCAKNIAVYPRGKIVAGRAENTGLSSSAVDFITVAQSFHWFDCSLFRIECGRILRIGGKVVLVWNLRNTASEVMQEIYAVHRRYCPSFDVYKKKPDLINARLKEFFEGSFEVREYENFVIYDRAGFISRNLSSSYSLTSTEEGFLEYKDCFGRIFDRYSVNGKLCVSNKIKSFIGSVPIKVQN